MSALARQPEPELMDEVSQAQAYSEADFTEAHQRFVDQIGARFGPLTGTALDVGCGPGDPTVRLALAHPRLTILAVDAGANMLDLARGRVHDAGLDDRIRLEQRHLPDPHLETMQFDAVVSNSLLHHLRDPMTLWRTVAACARPGAPVAVMDLMRPGDTATVDALVTAYAHDAPEVLQADFRNSLRAAYLVEEVEDQLRRQGLTRFEVAAISDRHLLVTGRR
jgi:ubiquinone/menaquinone biosynthesis C-methylase UbiE